MNPGIPLHGSPTQSTCKQHRPTTTKLEQTQSVRKLGVPPFLWNEELVISPGRPFICITSLYTRISFGKWVEKERNLVHECCIWGIWGTGEKVWWVALLPHHFNTVSCEWQASTVFLGFVSLAGAEDGLYSVQGGNYQVAQGLLDRSHANVIHNKVCLPLSTRSR